MTPGADHRLIQSRLQCYGGTGPSPLGRTRTAERATGRRRTRLSEALAVPSSSAQRRPVESSSELHVAEHFYAQSALADLSGIPTLRAAFPQMPRCELVDLRRHYWEVCREQNRVATEGLAGRRATIAATNTPLQWELRGRHRRTEASHPVPGRSGGTSGPVDVGGRRGGNEFHYPDDHSRPMPLDLWQGRTPIDSAERKNIHLTIQRIRSPIHASLESASTEPSTAARRAAIYRRVVRQALLELGILSTTWRLITLPLKPKKWAKIL